MTYRLVRHHAARVSEVLEPDSVDLIVTSPPYYDLRDYRDGGASLDGQIGREPTPAEFLDALVAATADWVKVLKPTGSLWVNLGDKYANDAKWGGATGGRHVAGLHGGTVGRSKLRTGFPAKSLMGLPWRYAIRCVDELGLILRAEVIWDKPNGLPESVKDRVRRSHEQWFHFTREPRYYAAIDEVREPHSGGSNPGRSDGAAPPAGKLTRQVANGDRGGTIGGTNPDLFNPLGKAPGSVWSVPSEPLDVPDAVAHARCCGGVKVDGCEDGLDHFAAFPSEWPRRIILGWSPSGFCTVCDQPRRPVVDRGGLTDEGLALAAERDPGNVLRYEQGAGHQAATPWLEAARRLSGPELVEMTKPRTITGYACACPTPDAPTRPAVVLDPFVGTGTTVAVAHHLGRHGIGTDLSADYLELAEWRCTADRRLRGKVLERTGLPPDPRPPKIPDQLDLFALEPIPPPVAPRDPVPSGRARRWCETCARTDGRAALCRRCGTPTVEVPSHD